MIKTLYFIAIVLPEAAENAVLQWKIKMELLYGCKAQFKSPAHITLMPPFSLNNANEVELIDAMKAINAKMSPVELHLNGFGFFGEHVVYIQVDKNEQLFQLNTKVGTVMKERLGISKPGFFDHPFRPHVTIAHRDLQVNDFHKARKWLENVNFHSNFVVNKVSLLRHNGKFWEMMG